MRYPVLHTNIYIHKTRSRSLIRSTYKCLINVWSLHQFIVHTCATLGVLLNLFRVTCASSQILITQTCTCASSHVLITHTCTCASSHVLIAHTCTCASTQYSLHMYVHVHLHYSHCTCMYMFQSTFTM